MKKPFALVIEDHVDAAIIFTEALKKAGFETEPVRAGDTALMRLSATEPDVILLDLNLPRVSGVDILESISTDPRLSNTHVIVATAHPQLAEDVREKSHVVLQKPVSFNELRRLAMRLNSAVRLDRQL